MIWRNEQKQKKKKKKNRFPQFRKRIEQVKWATKFYSRNWKKKNALRIFFVSNIAPRKELRNDSSHAMRGETWSFLLEEYEGSNRSNLAIIRTSWTIFNFLIISYTLTTRANSYPSLLLLK